MFSTEAPETWEPESLSEEELDVLDLEGKNPDGWPKGYPLGFGDLGMNEQAAKLDHRAIHDELNQMCAAAIDALPGSIKAEAPKLKPTEYCLLLNLVFSRREHVLQRLEAELYGAPECVPTSPICNHDLYVFPASIERLRRNITPTLEAREGTKSIDLDQRALTKAARGLSAKGLVTMIEPAPKSRGSYSWEIEILAIEKLASLHRPSCLALNDRDITQVAWLLQDWRIKTAQAAVLVPVRVAGLRQCPRDSEQFAVEHSNAELEALTGVRRRTAQKILVNARFARGLGVDSHEAVRKEGNKAIFRTEMTRVDMDECWPSRPAPRAILGRLRS